MRPCIIFNSRLGRRSVGPVSSVTSQRAVVLGQSAVGAGEPPRARRGLAQLRRVLVQPHLQLVEHLVRLLHLLGVDCVGHAAEAAPERDEQRGRAHARVEDGHGRDGVPGGKGPSPPLPTAGAAHAAHANPPHPAIRGWFPKKAASGQLRIRGYTEVGKSFPKASSFHVTAESGWKASRLLLLRRRRAAAARHRHRRAAHALSWSACRRARCSSCTCRRLGRTWSNVQCVQRLLSWCRRTATGVRHALSWSACSSTLSTRGIWHANSAQLRR